MIFHMPLAMNIVAFLTHTYNSAKVQPRISNYTTLKFYKFQGLLLLEWLKNKIFKQGIRIITMQRAIIQALGTKYCMNTNKAYPV